MRDITKEKNYASTRNFESMAKEIYEAKIILSSLENNFNISPSRGTAKLLSDHRVSISFLESSIKLTEDFPVDNSHFLAICDIVAPNYLVKVK